MGERGELGELEEEFGWVGVASVAMGGGFRLTRERGGGALTADGLMWS